MKVAYFTTLSNTSPEQAAQVSAKINEMLGHRPPNGAIFHTEGPTEEGNWWAFNVWDSDDAARAFSANILTPTLNDVGVTLEKAQRLQVAWDSNHPEDRG